ncbi:AI-2E family transporter [Candidatus Parcubacteria bacterium]|nr:AI-2E family transporter [Candidatus Parcubacteria bacterium]
MSDLERRRAPDKRQMIITTGSWVRAVIVIIVVLALFLIKDLLLVLLASIVIASAIEPAAVWAKRKGIPRLPSIIGIYISAALVFAGLFYFLFIPLLGEFTGFIAQFPDYASSLSQDTLFGSSAISLGDIAGRVNDLLLSFSQGVFTSASFVFGGFFSFILIVILSFYLAVQEDGVGKFLKVITPWKEERYIIDLWDRSKKKIGLWMQGQLLLAVIIAVLVYLGLLLLRLPHALLLSVAAGVFEIVPLFGPIIAAIPAVLVAFGAGGMPQALIVAGLYLIIHQFENQLIYPLVVKKVIGVPPMVSILALLIGGKLAGFLGILISVPMAAILMEFLSDLEREKSARIAAVTEDAS